MKKVHQFYQQEVLGTATLEEKKGSGGVEEGRRAVINSKYAVAGTAGDFMPDKI